MKLVKNFSRIVLISAFACSVVSTSCKKDEEKDCGASANKASTAGQTYASDPSVANCNAYKSALKAYVSDCGKDNDLTSFETVLENLTCD